MQVLFLCEREREAQEDSNSSLSELSGTGAPAKQTRHTSHFRGMRHHLSEQLDSFTVNKQGDKFQGNIVKALK